MKNLIIDFCEKREYPQAALQALTNGWEQIISVPKAFAVYNRASAMLREKTHDVAEQIRILNQVSELSCVNRKTLHLLFYICQTDYLRCEYEKEKIDLNIYEDTVADLKCKMYECYGLYGVWGCRVSGWLDGFFSMKKFALGRMQYEIRICDEQATLKNGRKIEIGDKVLVMHVPVSKTPFSDEVRAESYKKAYDFFEKKFDTEEIPFRITSWLLFPENKKILPKNSNIVRFMNDFTIVKEGVYPNHEELWRIFGKPFDGDYSTLKHDTSLQCAYADWVSNGNQTGYGVGYFIYDGKSFAK